MFEIEYRITTNIHHIQSLDEKTFDSEGDIVGFICLHFNEDIYGYCHHRPLGDDELGWDLLTNWIDSLLHTVVVLKTSNYVAISDIESYNTWLEFKRELEIVKVSIVEADKGSGTAYVVTSPLKDPQYGDWHGSSINFNEIRDEVIKKAKQYLDELAIINPQLLRSSRLSKLNVLILEALK